MDLKELDHNNDRWMELAQYTSHDALVYEQCCTSVFCYQSAS
jgi:hypothetical protein